MNKISYCGFECSKCPIFKSTILKDLEYIKSNFDNKTMCLGCNSNYRYIYCEKCNIRECCLSKRIDNCGKCNHYPCTHIGKLSNQSKTNLDKIKNG